MISVNEKKKKKKNLDGRYFRDYFFARIHEIYGRRILKFTHIVKFPNALLYLIIQKFNKKVQVPEFLESPRSFETF